MRTLALVVTLVAANAIAHDLDDGAGIAYTKKVTVSLDYDEDGTPRGTAPPFIAHVNLNVHGVVARWRFAAGSYDAQLFCPSGVGRRQNDTWQRTDVDVATETRFQLIVRPVYLTATYTYQCWLHVVVSPVWDGDSGLARRLSVEVVYRRDNDDRPDD